MDKAHSLPPTTDFVMEPSLAGITHVFAAPEQFCDNCGQQAQQAATVKHTVQVTSLLQDYVATGALRSLRPEHVKPFLTEGLKWRVVSVSLTSDLMHAFLAMQCYAMILCSPWRPLILLPFIPRSIGAFPCYHSFSESHQADSFAHLDQRRTPRLPLHGRGEKL